MLRVLAMLSNHTSSIRRPLKARCDVLLPCVSPLLLHRIGCVTAERPENFFYSVLFDFIFMMASADGALHR